MSFDHHFLGDDDDDTFNGSFRAVYRCYSAAFLNDRERLNIENGGKILLPQTALEQLIEQNDIMLFKITNLKYNRTTHCGVLEFLPSNEPFCYLPNWMMHHLFLDEGDELNVQSVISLPTATFARFQPQSKDFLDITNPKAVLEKQLRNFSCLTKGDLIAINYLDRIYELFVLELKPSDAVTIIECDMEVDFAPPIDYIEPKSNKQQVSQPNSYKDSTTFTPFHGQGNRLNGKTKTNDKEEQNKLEIPSRRGIPNYDYKYGLVQFLRVPLGSLNGESEENSSILFQPFTGERKILRQPRNQRPK